MATLTCFDVADYFLTLANEDVGDSISNLKLQKLVYFCQAWSLVWDEESLFNERIEAWANGPVIRDLYNLHKGAFKIDALRVGDPSHLTKDQKDTIDAVLDALGDKTAQWLSDLSHIDGAWEKTRDGLPEGCPCDRPIPLALIHEYYSSL